MSTHSTRNSASLADFSTLVAELEALDSVAVAVQSRNGRPDRSVPPQLEPSNVVRFEKKLDALIDLLEATADGLAAKSDQVSGEETFNAEDDFKPTVQ